MKMKDLPAITGFQLVRLLQLDGWVPDRKGRHGLALKKYMPDQKRTLVAIVPRTRTSLPKGTLGGILSTKQTGLRRDGLAKLIQKHGLK